MTDLLYLFNLLMCSTPPQWGHTLYTPCMYNTYELWTPVPCEDTHTHNIQSLYVQYIQTLDTNAKRGHALYTICMCTTNGKCGLQSKGRKPFIYLLHRQQVENASSMRKYWKQAHLFSEHLLNNAYISTDTVLLFACLSLLPQCWQQGQG